MFTIRTLARKVPMNNNYIRKMSYGFKDKDKKIKMVCGVLKRVKVSMKSTKNNLRQDVVMFTYEGEIGNLKIFKKI